MRIWHVVKELESIGVPTVATGLANRRGRTIPTEYRINVAVLEALRLIQDTTLRSTIAAPGVRS